MNVVDSSGWLEYYLAIIHHLPMADSIILATARAYNATLWTQDEHLKDIEGVRFIAKQKNP